MIQYVSKSLNQNSGYVNLYTVKTNKNNGATLWCVAPLFC